jgi:hypothetical protein
VSAKAELQELQDKRLAWQDKVGEAQRACVEAQRRGQREHALLLDYERSQGEGAEPDPKLHARLVKAWQEAREGLVATPAVVPHGGGLMDIATEWVDPALEARREGAERAHDDAKDEVRSFIEANIPRLAAEDKEEAEKEAADAAEWLAAGRGIANRAERKKHWWTGVAVQGDMEYLIGTIPGNVVGELLAAAPKVVRPPMPEPLLLPPQP